MVSAIVDIISIIFIFFMAGGLTLVRILLFTDKEELRKYGEKKTFLILGIITLVLMVIGIIVYLTR